MKRLLVATLLVSLFSLPAFALPPLVQQHPAFVRTGHQDVQPDINTMEGKITDRLIRVLYAKPYISSAHYGQANDETHSVFAFQINTVKIDEHLYAVSITAYNHHVGTVTYNNYISTGLLLVADDGREKVYTYEEVVDVFMKYLEDPPNPYPMTYLDDFQP